MSKRRKSTLSYSAGEKGRNRVRAFRHPSDGKLYLEWRENGKRRSVQLNTDDPEEAKLRADELAAELGRIEDAEETSAPITLRKLFERHGTEMTPTKGTSKQGHDKRAARLFVAFFDAQEEADRRSERNPTTLDRVDWDRFIWWRRAGSIPGWPKPVRNQQIRYDLQYLVAVLNWAVGAKLIPANPWRGDLRRAEMWGAMPEEKNPRRPSMTDDLREDLIQHSPHWQFTAALRLGRATGRRNSSIRRLHWRDIDQEVWEVCWRAEADKSDLEGHTDLTDEAIAVLESLPSRLHGGWVFPSESDSSRPTSRDTFQVWLRRAKARLVESLPRAERETFKARLRGVGYHSEKRAAVRSPEMRQLPPKIQEAIFGTRVQTLRMVYDKVGPEDIRAARKRGHEAANSEREQRMAAEGA